MSGDFASLSLPSTLISENVVFSKVQTRQVPKSVGVMVSKVDSSQGNETVAAADDLGFTGPCIGDKSLITTHNVDRCQAEVDYLGFTGPCLGDKSLIATHNVHIDSVQAAEINGGPSRRTMGRRLRKEKVEGKWKEIRRQAAVNQVVEGH